MVATDAASAAAAAAAVDVGGVVSSNEFYFVVFWCKVNVFEQQHTVVCPFAVVLVFPRICAAAAVAL